MKVPSRHGMAQGGSKVAPEGRDTRERNGSRRVTTSRSLPRRFQRLHGITTNRKEETMNTEVPTQGGWRLSEETKSRISAALTDRSLMPEHRRAISEAGRGAIPPHGSRNR